MHDSVFDETFSSALSYTSHMYSKVLAMQTELSYILYATSYHEKNGNIITLEQFEEGDLVENERNTENDESIFFN